MLPQDNILSSSILKSCRETLAKELKGRDVGDSDGILYELLKEHYLEEPASIEEFISNPYYLGTFGQTLFPIWREKLRNIYPSKFYSPYYLVILQAAIGGGKSAILGTMGLYELHKTLCLKNPALFYGLQENDMLYFLFYTFKKKIAEDGNWTQFLSMMLESDYFKQHVDPPATPYAGSLTKNISCRVVSLSNDLVSKAVIFAGMDEFNEKKHSNSSNKKIYNEMLRRMDSRLLDSDGNQPYKLVIASSPKDESDELGQTIDDIRQKGLESGCLIVDGVTAMDTSGVRLDYSAGNFQVYVDAQNSYIMDDKEDRRVPDFDEDKIWEVPKLYYRSFQLDLIGAIREILGVRIGSTGRFFRDEKLIDEVFTKTNLTPDTLILPFNIGYENGVNFLFDSISKQITFPEAPRCIHLDTALSGDRLGIGSSFVIPMQESPFNFNTLRDDTFKNAMIINDFSLGIETADSQEIPLDVVVGCLLKLKEFGYQIHVITWDSFQSASIRQPLERNRMNNKYLSVDISKEPFIILKRAMLSNRFLGANNQLVKTEAKGLLNLPKKIDHSSTGSKDVIDGVTGSVYSCYENLDILLQASFIKKERAPASLRRTFRKAGFRQIT